MPQEIQVQSKVSGSTVGPVDHDEPLPGEVDADATPTTAPTVEETTTADEGVQTEQQTQTAYSDEDRELFGSMFTDIFGVSVEEARLLMSDVKNVQQTAQVLPFAQAWGVDIPEANRRVDQVLAYIQKLPEAESKPLLENGTIEDVIEIYDRIASAKGQRRSLFGQRQRGGTTVGGTPRVKTYTQTEIDSMSPQQRRAADADILLAYQEGRVSDV